MHSQQQEQSYATSQQQNGYPDGQPVAVVVGTVYDADKN